MCFSMRYPNIIKYILPLVSLLGIIGCQSDYTKMLNREAKEGIQKDSLILGLVMGENRTDFYRRCWQLNQERLITQGPKKETVEYSLPLREDEKSVFDITLLFYGIFNAHDIMIGMDMSFYYTAWAPWNSELTAQQLLPKVQDTLRSWFPGNDFIAIESDNLESPIYVKIDGNRQISAYVKDDKDVVVKIEDLKQKYPEKFKR